MTIFVMGTSDVCAKQRQENTVSNVSGFIGHVVTYHEPFWIGVGSGGQG